MDDKIREALPDGGINSMTDDGRNRMIQLLATAMLRKDEEFQTALHAPLVAAAEYESTRPECQQCQGYRAQTIGMLMELEVKVASALLTTIATSMMTDGMAEFRAGEVTSEAAKALSHVVATLVTGRSVARGVTDIVDDAVLGASRLSLCIAHCGLEPNDNLPYWYEPLRQFYVRHPDLLDAEPESIIGGMFSDEKPSEETPRIFKSIFDEA